MPSTTTTVKHFTIQHTPDNRPDLVDLLSETVQAVPRAEVRLRRDACRTYDFIITFTYPVEDTLAIQPFLEQLQ